MKKRFTEEQIVKILGEQKLGKQVKEIAREYGISTEPASISRSGS